MTDDDFIAQLEACTLPAGQFHHRDHLHAAWLYLTRFTTLEAIGRFTEVLRRYAVSLGKPDRYHATITWAYLLVLNERIRALGTSLELATICGNALRSVRLEQLDTIHILLA